MGCGKSNNVVTPQATSVTLKLNKKTGAFEEPKSNDRPENDMTLTKLAEDEKKDKILAAAYEDAERKNNESVSIVLQEPDVDYALEYVYGRKSRTSCKVMYTPKGEIVYTSAALGVIMNIQENNQKFFGGKEYSKAALKNPTIWSQHNNEITAFCVSVNLEVAASAQSGKTPIIYIWSTLTGALLSPESIIKYKENDKAIEISAIGFSTNCEYIAVGECHKEEKYSIIRCFELKTCAEVFQKKYEGVTITALEWNKGRNCNTLCTILSTGEIKLLDPLSQKGKFELVVYESASCKTHFTSLTYNFNGICYFGCAKGQLHPWRELNGKMVRHIPPVNVCKGPITALAFTCELLVIGSNDGIVYLYDNLANKVGEFSTEPGTITSLDMQKRRILIGYSDGRIRGLTLTSMTDFSTRCIMDSHSDEVHALDVNKDGIVSAGYDNKVISWDIGLKIKTFSESIIQETPQNDMQVPRSLAIHPVTGAIAVGLKSGVIQIRYGALYLSKILYPNLKISTKGIEFLSYSSNGDYLAAGSLDGNVYVLDCKNSYVVKGKILAHSNYIAGIDWATNSKFIRAYSLPCKVTICEVETFKEITEVPKDVEWSNVSARILFGVEGIFSHKYDEGYINTVSASQSKKIIAAGDEDGLLRIYRYPSKEGSAGKHYRGHACEVSKLVFAESDSYIITVGGSDRCVMQWRKK